MINKENFHKISSELQSKHIALVAVSKTKSVEEIKELYDLGQRDFGENYVQELVQKQQQLPADIRWHFIGHLQTNKVKSIIPFIWMIQGVDSFKLLNEINKQSIKSGTTTRVLLQVHISGEETKFGMDEKELGELFENSVALNELKNVRIEGLMGMASFTNDIAVIRKEFRLLKSLFDHYRKKNNDNISLSTLSMGMSSDYTTAVEEGSNMVRIGSLLFGERTSV